MVSSLVKKQGIPQTGSRVNAGYHAGAVARPALSPSMNQDVWISVQARLDLQDSPWARRLDVAPAQP